MRRVTQKDITNINEVYLVCKNYAKTAEATGWSASTVKKYIIPNYISQREEEKIDIELPSINSTAAFLAIGTALTLLSDEEKEELKLLWKEILV